MTSNAPSSLAAAELFSVKDLVAVVTGGATGKLCSVHRRSAEIQLGLPDNEILVRSDPGRAGIGLMMVKALEENGAKVYIVGRRKEVLEKVAKEEAVRSP